MRRQRIPWLISLSGLLVLAGCDGQSGLLPSDVVAAVRQAATTDDSQAIPSAVAETIAAKVPAPLVIKAAELLERKGLPWGRKLLRLHISIPRDASVQLAPDAFSTQALPVSSIIKIKASLAGIGMAAPLSPEGTDAGGFLPVSSTGTAVVDFVAPVGANRIVTVEGYAAGNFLMAGSTLKGVLDIAESSVSNTSIHFRTTPAAQVVEALTVADPLLGSTVDEAALQSFIDTNLTLPSATTPIKFQTHPTLLNTQTISQAILSLNADQPPGAPVLLPDAASWDMFVPSKTLKGTIHLSADFSSANLRVDVFDPASAAPGYAFSGSFVGPVSISYMVTGITPNAAGKPWYVQLSGIASGNKQFSTPQVKTADLTRTTTVDFFIF